MKILRIVLVVGGLALMGYGLYTALWPHDSGTTAAHAGGFSEQVIGMIGVGTLAALAGFFMSRRR